jgi:flavorubredoxin
MKALVVYHSQEFGNTKAMAEAVAEGLKTAGAEVDLFNTNDGRFEFDGYAAYDCVAVGSPDYYSYVAGGLKVFIDDFHVAVRAEGGEALKNKRYGLFYSHGGGGRVRGPLEDLFRRLGTKVGETVESKGAPSGECLAKCRELGSAFAGAKD